MQIDKAILKEVRNSGKKTVSLYEQKLLIMWSMRSITETICYRETYEFLENSLFFKFAEAGQAKNNEKIVWEKVIDKWIPGDLSTCKVIVTIKKRETVHLRTTDEFDIWTDIKDILVEKYGGSLDDFEVFGEKRT